MTVTLVRDQRSSPLLALGRHFAGVADHGLTSSLPDRPPGDELGGVLYAGPCSEGE